MAQFHPLKVKNITKETSEAVSIAFDIPPTLQTDYQFKQGQYLTLKLNIDGKEYRRSYSICNSPYGDKEWRVAIKEVNGGVVSTYLNQKSKIGDTIEVMTPMGSFYTILNGGNQKHYVLFAGGSGITPMMSIIKSVLYIEKKSKITLVYANKNEKSTIFKKELETLVELNTDKLQTVFVYETPEESVNAKNKGLLTLERINQIHNINPILNADEYFICGPAPMMESVKNTLESNKTAKEKIHIEYFSAVMDELNKQTNSQTTQPANVTANVTIVQYGIETNFTLKTLGHNLLEAAIEAGVDAPFSCKGAVCCTCRAKVVEGKVMMKNNFALTEKEVEEGYILTCQAHPISEKVVIDYDAI